MIVWASAKGVVVAFANFSIGADSSVSVYPWSAPFSPERAINGWGWSSAGRVGSPPSQPSPATSKVGRLYFSLPNVKTGRLELFECSASSVTSANESVLVTAGHCLTQNGRTSQNVVFIPGLNGQSQPHGTWSAQTTFATPAGAAPAACEC